VEDGATHRYMTSSPACFASFNALGVDGRGLETSAWRGLLVDGFAAHHPGSPSPQSIQSVAIHLMVLHGVFDRGFEPHQAMWLRTRPGRPSRTPKHERFVWLTPPDLHLGIAVSDVEQAAPPMRAGLLGAWLQAVYAAWSAPHRANRGLVRSLRDRGTPLIRIPANL
jgi:hypothetical protein